MPPPVAAPQPIRCEAALSPPSIAQAVPTMAAPAPATARPPAGLCRGCRFRCSRRCLRSSGESFRCFRFRELLGSEALDVPRRRALHLRRPLPRPLQQGFRGPSDDLRRRHFVRWGGQSRWAPRDSQRAVQQSPPPRRASIVWFSDTLLTAAAAPAAPPATIASAA